jgi:hypothetical protein
MATHVSNTQYYGADHAAIHTTAERRISLFSWHGVLKWFGMLSTGLLGAAALAPDVFRIPTAFRPWVFIIAIFWILAFCAGMFDL